MKAGGKGGCWGFEWDCAQAGWAIAEVRAVEGLGLHVEGSVWYERE